MKSFKTELIVNNKTNTLFYKYAGTARYAYNWGLEETFRVIDNNKNNPENKEKFPSSIDLHKKFINEEKTKNTWIKEISKWVPQESLRNLDTSWKRFFNKKLKSGVPNFKKKGNNESFYLEGKIEIKGNKIKLPRLGWIRCHEQLPEIHKSKSGSNITISLRAGRWYISYKVDELPKKIDNIELLPKIGGDLGIKKSITLSDGKVFDNPKPSKSNKRKITKLQRRLDRKKKGSKNREKIKIKLQRKHQTIANIRKDHSHKLTFYIAKNHSQVNIENLNTKGMMKSHCLASAIADANFGEILRQLKYKCEWYGSELIIIDRFFPSSKLCSKCLGYKKDFKLSDRIYECGECGLIIDRDLNAAINILNYLLIHKVNNVWYFKNNSTDSTLSEGLGEVMSVKGETKPEDGFFEAINPMASISLDFNLEINRNKSMQSFVKDCVSV